MCSGCHQMGGIASSTGLFLVNEQTSAANLIGVASSEVPSLLRVSPGDPDNSYLIQKLEGTAAEGARMPLGGDPLPQSDIDTIRQWITDGASQ